MADILPSFVGGALGRMVGSALDSAPETLNSDPYGSGWILEVGVSAPASSLMDGAAYTSLIG